ncbi:hypothetical protein [uncultured Alistipes sp.]|jgi:hypothetical protein|uniref:hypothetical protein n=1 Tax=uncultured Alistipes sp. TaxID=538949 RepID=UPI0025FC55D4|nr:hypothetical protein [uncultured Alistipes sp.]
MMKTLRITAVVIILLCTGNSLAQNQVGGITVTKPRIEKVDEVVKVEFTAASDKKSVKRNYSLMIAPSITDGTYTWSLPPLIVSGRGGRISLDRQILASGRDMIFDGATFARTGGTVHYSASVPYQEWMEGATLNLEALSVGCCSASPLVSQVMADELKLQPTQTEYAEMIAGATTADSNRPADELHPEHPQSEVTPIEAEPLTTASKLEESYTFIAPASDYKPIAPGELYVEDREGTIRIQFPVGSFAVQRSYGDNEQSITDLMSSIRIIENSVDSRVMKVTVAGFSSPEGDYDLNDRLAWRRAVAMKEYILSHSDLSADQIEIYKGSVDWQGLRMLVEASDMPWKQKVLDIIDDVPVWDARRNSGRHGELMRLEGGVPYRYMKKNYFPQLRNAAFIKVFHENKNNP